MSMSCCGTAGTKIHRVVHHQGAHVVSHFCSCESQHAVLPVLQTLLMPCGHSWCPDGDLHPAGRLPLLLTEAVLSPICRLCRCRSTYVESHVCKLNKLLCGAVAAIAIIPCGVHHSKYGLWAINTYIPQLIHVFQHHAAAWLTNNKVCTCQQKCAAKMTRWFSLG